MSGPLTGAGARGVVVPLGAEMAPGALSPIPGAAAVLGAPVAPGVGSLVGVGPHKLTRVDS